MVAHVCRVAPCGRGDSLLSVIAVTGFTVNRTACRVQTCLVPFLWMGSFAYSKQVLCFALVDPMRRCPAALRVWTAPTPWLAAGFEVFRLLSELWQFIGCVARVHPVRSARRDKQLSASFRSALRRRPSSAPRSPTSTSTPPCVTTCVTPRVTTCVTSCVTCSPRAKPPRKRVAKPPGTASPSWWVSFLKQFTALRGL